MNHPRTQVIRKRFPNIPHITCHRYQEIFNRKAQDFRLQKQTPALLLAKKFDNFVLEAPKGSGIGGEKNYYFSHMLNCLFDCRYCFLQGMYRSAHCVVFVNFEDFHEAIKNTLQTCSEETIYFFSGYDCDSLALEPITHFVEDFLPLFRQLPRAFLEMRTKSVQISTLLTSPPIPNAIVAFSLSPQPISTALEHKTAPLHRRLQAIQKLQKAGWSIGLRFDPILYFDPYQSTYRNFFAQVFAHVDIRGIHSVSLGPFRMPRDVFKNIARLYPEEQLFAHSLCDQNTTVSYSKELAEELLDFCSQEVLRYIPPNILFVYEKNPQDPKTSPC